jgi:hypothetical protein
MEVDAESIYLALWKIPRNKNLRSRTPKGLKVEVQIDH